MGPLLTIFSLLATLGMITSSNFTDVPLPRVLALENIYEDSAVVGYKVTINSRYDCKVEWTSVVPNPDQSDTQFTYQVVSSNQSGQTITTTVLEPRSDRNFTIVTELHSATPIGELVYSLRLTVDTERGPVKLYLFVANRDLLRLPQPTLSLPETSNYYVPDKQNEINDEGIMRRTNLVIPINEAAPGFTVHPSFARVFEQWWPKRQEGAWKYSDNYVWLTVPRHPALDNARYRPITVRNHHAVEVSQSFRIDNANRNDSGLYQFDVVLKTPLGVAWRVSVPFLLRQRRYEKAYLGVLPCSAYRRDTRGTFVRHIGVLTGDRPCVKYVALGQRDNSTNIQFSLLGKIWKDQKTLPEASYWQSSGLDDYKELQFLINPEDDIGNWTGPGTDISRPSSDNVAVTSRSKNETHRQNTMVFTRYEPVRLAPPRTEANATTLTLSCQATGAANLTVKIVRVQATLYEQLRAGDRVYQNKYELANLTPLISSYYRGVISGYQTEDGDKSLLRYTVILDKARMSRLWADNHLPICLAYHDFGLATALFESDDDRVNETNSQ